MYRPIIPSSPDILPLHHIDKANAQIRIDKTGYKLKVKVPTASFSLYPLKGEQRFSLIVTPKDLPGRFKNSGYSTFGHFEVNRLPGRNSVLRLADTSPLAGNAVMMWPLVTDEEKQKCFDYVEKIIRSFLPRLPFIET